MTSLTRRGVSPSTPRSTQARTTKLQKWAAYVPALPPTPSQPLPLRCTVAGTSRTTDRRGAEPGAWSSLGLASSASRLPRAPRAAPSLCPPPSRTCSTPCSSPPPCQPRSGPCTSTGSPSASSRRPEPHPRAQALICRALGPLVASLLPSSSACTPQDAVSRFVPRAAPDNSLWKHFRLFF